MSTSGQARGFGLNGKSYYTNVAGPRSVWCSFVVASGNGLGVTSLKSNGYIDAVFMHTTTTPTSSPNGILNPNPQAGYAVVRFQNNFNVYLGQFSSQLSVLTATTTTALTAGHVYVITAMGNTTQAQWQTAGLAPGFTAAVGVAFVAAATASIAGTGTVGVPGVPLANSVSAVGTTDLTLNNANLSVNDGAQVVLQFAKATDATTTTLLPASPADGTLVRLNFNFDGSTVTVDGL